MTNAEEERKQKDVIVDRLSGPYSPIRIVGWGEYMVHMRRLAMMIPKGARLWGISRGGYVLASLMVYPRPDLTNVSGKVLASFPSDDIVIIDGIADTGATLRATYLDAYRTAVLYRRFACNMHPDLVVVEMEEGDERWLQFPYDVSYLDTPGSRQTKAKEPADGDRDGDSSTGESRQGTDS